MSITDKRYFYGAYVSKWNLRQYGSPSFVLLSAAERLNTPPFGQESRSLSCKLDFEAELNWNVGVYILVKEHDDLGRWISETKVRCVDGELFWNRVKAYWWCNLLNEQARLNFTYPQLVKVVAAVWLLNDCRQRMSRSTSTELVDHTLMLLCKVKTSKFTLNNLSIDLYLPCVVHQGKLEVGIRDYFRFSLLFTLQHDWLITSVELEQLAMPWHQLKLNICATGLSLLVI